MHGSDSMLALSIIKRPIFFTHCPCQSPRAFWWTGYSYLPLLLPCCFHLGSFLLLLIVHQSNNMHASHSHDICDFGKVTCPSKQQQRSLNEYPGGSFCAVYNKLAMRDSSLSKGMSIKFKASCVSWRVSSVTANVKWTGEVKGTRIHNSSIWKLKHLLMWNEIVRQEWGKLGAWRSSWLFSKCNGQCGLQSDWNWSVRHD